MARHQERAEAARRKLKRAGGLQREALAELAAIADGADVLAELDLERTTDLPRAEDLLGLTLAQYGRVHLTITRSGATPPPRRPQGA